MKISREYLLGLGSGLILSALLLFIFPATFTNTPADKNSSDAASAKSAAVKENPPAQTSESQAQTTANAQEKASSENAAQGKKNIVISPGMSADKIAQLLQTEGLIQKKEDFMAFVKAKKLESRFKAGNYELQTGLSLEDLVNQLIR
ncbi:endolytic transglycosylase MltG [Desulfitobacterium sp. AusDCA]|uniref:endolytic transglycosylase MltG n=1 Tax=Desulfitobacterium sp. AusDCA TaxID=3240383 RepID=UPI003DA793D7